MVELRETNGRVRTAGVRRARNEQRWMLAAWVGAGVAGVVLVVTVLRPLPRPEFDRSGVSVLDGRSMLSEETVSERQKRLDALASAGNVFAVDREAWPVDVVAGADDELAVETEPEQEPEVTVTERSDVPVTIELTERPTAAAKKARDALTLRGLFASGDRRIAMIQGGESDRRKDVELYREGDVFFADTWRLVKIEPENDRVILEHLGQGDVVALTLYDASVPRLVAAVPEPAPVTAIARSTEAEAREGLLDAGIEEAEVDRVFEMLAAIERGEDVAALDDGDGLDEASGVAQVDNASDQPGTEANQPRKAGEAPAMPPALAELLRSMATDAQSSRRSGESDPRR